VRGFLQRKTHFSTSYVRRRNPYPTHECLSASACSRKWNRVFDMAGFETRKMEKSIWCFQKHHSHVVCVLARLLAHAQRSSKNIIYAFGFAKDDAELAMCTVEKRTQHCNVSPFGGSLFRTSKQKNNCHPPMGILFVGTKCIAYGCTGLCVVKTMPRIAYVVSARSSKESQRHVQNRTRNEH
jgi:hypothetical protein